MPTFTSRIVGGGIFTHHTEYRSPTKSEVIKGSSYPGDYDFLKVDYGYVCGMSVPPYMMRGIVNKVIELVGW